MKKAMNVGSLKVINKPIDSFLVFLEICEQISVNLSNGSDDEDDKLKETIVNSSARSCELMITDNDPVDSMPLKLGETKPTYPVDIVPGTFLS